MALLPPEVVVLLLELIAPEVVVLQLEVIAPEVVVLDELKSNHTESV